MRSHDACLLSLSTTKAPLLLLTAEVAVVPSPFFSALQRVILGLLKELFSFFCFVLSIAVAVATETAVLACELALLRCPRPPASRRPRGDRARSLLGELRSQDTRIDRWMGGRTREDSGVGQSAVVQAAESVRVEHAPRPPEARPRPASSLLAASCGCGLARCHLCTR